MIKVIIGMIFVMCILYAAFRISRKILGVMDKKLKDMKKMEKYLGNIISHDFRQGTTLRELMEKHPGYAIGEKGMFKTEEGE